MTTIYSHETGISYKGLPDFSGRGEVWALPLAASVLCLSWILVAMSPLIGLFLRHSLGFAGFVFVATALQLVGVILTLLAIQIVNRCVESGRRRLNSLSIINVFAPLLGHPGLADEALASARLRVLTIPSLFSDWRARFDVRAYDLHIAILALCMLGSVVFVSYAGLAILGLTGTALGVPIVDDVVTRHDLWGHLLLTFNAGVLALWAIVVAKADSGLTALRKAFKNANLETKLKEIIRGLANPEDMRDSFILGAVKQLSEILLAKIAGWSVLSKTESSSPPTFPTRPTITFQDDDKLQIDRLAKLLEKLLETLKT